MKLMRGHWMWNFLGLLFVAAIFYAIWVPNQVRSGPHPKWTCIANLKQIDGAIQAWALDNKVADTNAPNWTAARQYLKDGKLPKCPEGGTYAPGATIADPPTCSKGASHGHTLP